MDTTHCFSCNAIVPNIEGATHPYILSSPGCWKLYGDILAKEYTPEYYDEYTHRITEHKEALRSWGQSVWNIWKEKHETTIVNLAG